ALHHIRTRQAKGSLYRTLARSLRARGQLVVVECQPASRTSIARRQFDEWRAHLRRSYSAAAARRLMAAWAKEDVYVPLEVETARVADAGFHVEILWRKGAFAVLLGTRW